MKAVDTHPQKQLIIDAIIAGKHLRGIAETLTPKVSYSTLCRYKQDFIAPAIRNLRGNSDKIRTIKHLANSKGMLEDSHAIRNIERHPPATSETPSGLKDLLEARIDKRLSRREKWIKDAEGLDADGKPLKDMDHRALATHDRNEGSDIETLAKLGGLLQQTAPVSQVLQVVVSMPAPVSHEQAECITLDVLPER